MCKTKVRTCLCLSFMTTCFLLSVDLSTAFAGNIELKSSTGVVESDGATPLLGDGFAGPEDDDLVQCLYAGPDGLIDPADSQGYPTGDDVLLETAEFPGVFNTVIGEGFPFNPDQGMFVEDFSHSLNMGDLVYCRAWNGSDLLSAPCYGDSQLVAIQDVNFDSVDLGTWATDVCGGECVPGATQVCDTGGQGVCAAGTQTCEGNGFWGGCVQDVAPSTEVCDGLDNDCDGLADGSELLTQPCGVSDVGECSFGIETCDDLGNWTVCTAVLPAPELCDGLDNDCDGVSDPDSDGDGALDCAELCDNDPLKTEPGVCGCGVADTDSDGDGAADCNDNCPNDPNKTEPGVCGCGVPETDSDGDGAADCNDNCPNDPNKTEPGVCGCGVPETDCQGCMEHADCDDGNLCTDDICVDFICQTVDNTASCSNGLFCDGEEMCQGGACQPGTPVPIDDGVLCTMDSCDEEEDKILHIPEDSVCDDGEFCNGAEVCDLVNDCQPGPPPVPGRRERVHPGLL
ncbi:MAG: MopE-related protein [Myxococcota bacterium]|nr:MopE-related protein [Myxococcota bacterium]